MTEYDIAVIAGDGIGPEVTREAMKVLDAAAEVYGFKTRKTYYPFGTEHWLKTNEIFLRARSTRSRTSARSTWARSATRVRRSG